MAKKDTELFTAELFNSLFAGRDPKTLLDSGGLIGDAKRHWHEHMLNAEMDIHLYDEAEAGSCYHRNGSNAKTTLTSEGPMQRPIPPDRPRPL